MYGVNLEYAPVFADVNLVLAGVPIGNIGDASARLLDALRAAEIIACEDTRRTRDLIRRLNLESHARLVAYHEHNEAQLTPQLLSYAAENHKVLMVSDAGMPGISDPGFRLIRAATQSHTPFRVIPGPSAALLAVVVSGLPTDSFTFVGFLPRKPEALYRTLRDLDKSRPTMIFYESPRRVKETLRAMLEIFTENRPAALIRELTKTHEEVLRGSLGEILKELDKRDEVLGEIVIVVAGASGEKNAVGAETLHKLDQLVQKGLRAKDAAKLLSQWHNIPAKEIYETYINSK